MYRLSKSLVVAGISLQLSLFQAADASEVALVVDSCRGETQPLQRPRPPLPVTPQVGGTRIEFDNKKWLYRFTWKDEDGHPHHAEKPLACAIDIRIKCCVDVADGLTTYEYGLENLPSSQRSLESATIFAPGDIRACQSGSADWEIFALPANTRRNAYYRIHHKELTEDPVGMPKGCAIRGLVVKSTGLPTIVKCRVFGATPVLEVEDDAPDGLYQFPAYAGFYDRVDGFTIGPALATEESEAGVKTVIERLLADLSKAKDLGWISSEGAYGQLSNQLKVISKEGCGDRAERLVALMELSRELCDQAPPVISGDVYGLIVGNCKWLLGIKGKG